MCKHFAYQTLLIYIIYFVRVSIDSPKPDSEQSLKLNLLFLQVLVDSNFGSASGRRRLLQVQKCHPGNVPLFGRYTNFLFSVGTNEKNSLQRRTQQNKH